MPPENNPSREDDPPKEERLKEDRSHESSWELNQRLRKGLWINFLLYAAVIAAAVWALLH